MTYEREAVGKRRRFAKWITNFQSKQTRSAVPILVTVLCVFRYDRFLNFTSCHRYNRNAVVLE